MQTSSNAETTLSLNSTPHKELSLILFTNMACQTVGFLCIHGMVLFDILEGLAYIMNELFGGVVYAGIDTDKHRYPIGNLIYIIVTD